MREIKFRAWSNEHNRYCDFVTLDENGKWIGWIKSSGVYLTTIDIILEQYTGFKDTNGKEICEGDLVKGRWWRAKNARIDTEGEIKFNDGWFYIKDDPDGQDRLGVPIHNCYNLEIIGNIHENPELLKEEE